MADNVALPASGVTAATDDIGGVHYQRIKTGFGAEGSYSDVAPANGMPTGSSYTELTGSAAANNTDLIASTDVRAYAYASVQITGTWSATVSIQGSNDGTTWVDLPYARPNNIATGRAAITSNNVHIVARTTRYMRVRTSSYSSGTVTATMQLFSAGGWGFSAIAGVNGPYDVSLNQNLPSGDANTGTVQGHYASALVYNGTTWDRVRNVTAVDGLGSTGLLAAGAIAYDAGASVNRRVRCDGTGALHTKQVGNATSALTSVGTSVTSVQLLAAKASRVDAIIHNESTARLLIAYAATASATAYTVPVPAGGTWQMATGGEPWTGVISGIWEADDDSFARITEIG